MTQESAVKTTPIPTYSACLQRRASALKAKDRFPIKNVGNDEDDGFPFPASALARRSATACKREDKLHGNDLNGLCICSQNR